MQKPFEGISLYLLLVMSDSEQHDIPRDSQSTTPPEHEDSLSNAETLRLFSQLLDSKLDQKFTSFKRELEEKDNLTQSQLKKLKTETKASNTFNYKGNRVQFEFNLNVLDQIETASKNLRAGKVSSATSDLEEAKKLIISATNLCVSPTRAPQVGLLLKSMSPTNSPTIQKTRKSSVQPRRGRCRRFVKRKENFNLPVPELRSVSQQRKPKLLSRLLLLSILSIFNSPFAISPFVQDNQFPLTNVSAAANADIGQIPQFVPVATTSLETHRAPNQQTDDGSRDKYDAALKRLGQDEYPLPVSPVNSLGDCDPVDFFYQSTSDPNFHDSPEICPDYQEDVQNIAVKGRLRRNISFWEYIGASWFIRQTILEGYKIPFYFTPAPATFGNNKSSLQHADFVHKAITDLLAVGSVVECSSPPSVINPLSVSIQSNGKKRLILDLRYPNSFVKKFTIKFEDAKTMLNSFIDHSQNWFYSFDIKSGYHHIDIFPPDQDFLGFSWSFSGVTRYFKFTVLPFGLSTGPYIFTKVMRPLVKYWRSQAYRIVVYLDDGLGVCPTFACCRLEALAVKSDLSRAGFVPNMP